MGVKGGLLGTVLDLVFGGDRNAVAETVEVFRPNAERSAKRAHALSEAALAQFAAEFAQARPSLFDRVIDGLNRVPRPAMALGSIGLFAAAMVDPIWFAERMQGLALVPEPLWWLLGAVVSFYFGARHQAKSQEFQRSIAATLARAPEVQANLRSLQELRPQPAQADADGAEARSPDAAAAPDAADPDAVAPMAARPNAALAEWRQTHGGG